VGLVLPAQLVRPALKAHKASKDRSVLRGQSGSRGRPARQDRLDQLDRKVLKAKLVAKAQSAPPASADRQGRKARLAHPAPPDRLARRVIPARHRQFASSRVRIALAAETTKSWPVSFAQAARPTERSARPLERQQLVYAYVGERAIRSAYLAFWISLVQGARESCNSFRQLHPNRRSASISVSALAAAKMVANNKSPCANARPQPKAESAASASSSGSVTGGTRPACSSTPT
jgi:hypothetical protein